MDSIHHFKAALSVFVQTAPTVLLNRGEVSLCWRQEVVDAYGRENMIILLTDMINTIPGAFCSIYHGVDKVGPFSVLTLRNTVIVNSDDLLPEWYKSYRHYKKLSDLANTSGRLYKGEERII